VSVAHPRVRPGIIMALRAAGRTLGRHVFEDLAMYAELARPAQHRSMGEDADEEELRQAALVVVRDWAQRR